MVGKIDLPQSCPSSIWRFGEKQMKKNDYRFSTRLADTDISEESIKIVIDRSLSGLGNALIDLGYSNVRVIPNDFHTIKMLHSWLTKNTIQILVIPMLGNIYKQFGQFYGQHWKINYRSPSRKYVVFNIANSFMEYVNDADLACKLAFAIQYESGIVHPTVNNSHVVDITDQHIANLKRHNKRRQKEQEYKKRNNRTLKMIHHFQ